MNNSKISFHKEKEVIPWQHMQTTILPPPLIEGSWSSTNNASIYLSDLDVHHCRIKISCKSDTNTAMFYKKDIQQLITFLVDLEQQLEDI